LSLLVRRLRFLRPFALNLHRFPLDKDQYERSVFLCLLISGLTGSSQRNLSGRRGVRIIAIGSMIMMFGLGSLHALADESKKLPPSGKVKFQVSYVQPVGKDVKLTDKIMFGTFGFYGITRVTDGDPVFDRLTEHCTGQHYGFETKSGMMNGSCLYTDADGDKMMINWVDDAPPSGGTKKIVGGTGKFAGITGGGPYTSRDLPQPDADIYAWTVDVDLDYKVAPTQ
jgi:hypothetical protein